MSTRKKDYAYPKTLQQIACAEAIIADNDGVLPKNPLDWAENGKTRIGRYGRWKHALIVFPDFFDFMSDLDWLQLGKKMPGLWDLIDERIDYGNMNPWRRRKIKKLCDFYWVHAHVNNAGRKVRHRL